MSRARLSRPRLLAASAAARGPRPPRLRWFWWGNPDRNKRTYAVVDLYDEKHPDITIEAETIGWDDYWAKMATQASGQNMADVVQMDYRYLFEYARRQQLEPLDDYIGDTLDLSHFDDSFLDSGRVGGQLYAVPWTSNSIACFYDQDKLAELGVAMPDHTWTYDDLRTLAGEVKKQGGENYWGVADKGHWEPALECFLRQRGKALYTEDGSLGYGEEDVADYFGLWQGMRDEGLVPTPEITVRDTDLPNMPLTHRLGCDRLRALEPARGAPGPEPAQARHEHVPEPAGRPAGAVSQAFDADLGERYQPGQGRGRQVHLVPRLRPGRRGDPARRARRAGRRAGARRF